MDITWERLILPSLRKKQPKKYISGHNHFTASIICFYGGVRVLLITFLRHPVNVMMMVMMM